MKVKFKLKFLHDNKEKEKREGIGTNNIILSHEETREARIFFKY